MLSSRATDVVLARPEVGAVLLQVAFRLTRALLGAQVIEDELRAIHAYYRLGRIWAFLCDPEMIIAVYHILPQSSRGGGVLSKVLDYAAHFRGLRAAYIGDLRRVQVALQVRHHSSLVRSN